MNKILKQMCLLCLLLIVASCNKDPEYYTLEVPADQMLLKASSTEITLGKEKENETAVTFTWDKATDRGADAKISYFFRMCMVELNSNKTDLYEIEAGERSISFTHAQLNDILAAWNMTPGDKVTIEAEVIAQANSSVQYLKPELSKTRLDVAGYDKNAIALYMVMVDNSGERTVRRMTEKFIGTGVYQASVDLKPCKYFFAMNPDADYPCYMKGESGDNSLQYVTAEGDYEMLENTRAGAQVIVVDLNMLDVNIVKAYTLPKDGIWIIGSSCDAGWDMNKAREKCALQNKDPRHPELWTYTGNFYAKDGANPSEFKLTLELDWGGKFFFAPQNMANPAIEHELGEARYQGDGGDLKWTIAADAKYTLSVDLNTMQINLTPVN